MSPNFRLQAGFLWIASLIFVFAFVDSSHIFPRSRLTSLLRATRWDKIEKHFQRHNPRRDHEKYAIALAILKSRKLKKHTSIPPKKVVKAFYYLVSTLTPPCTKAKNEKQLLACLQAVPLESHRKPFHRIVAWQGSVQAERFGLHKLSKRMVSLANLHKKDLISTKLFQQRLGLLLRSKLYREAWVLARRKDLEHFNSPFANLLKARSMAHSGRKAQAAALYFQIGKSTRTKWILNSVFQDLKYFKIISFHTRNYKASRELTAFSDILTAKEFKKLKKVIPPSSIFKTTNTSRLRGDGMYLIRSGFEKKLLRLNKKFLSQLSKQQKTLNDWITHLRKKKRDKVALQILNSHTAKFRSSSDLWFHYLELLDKKYEGKKVNKKYVQEILAYLKAYPYSSRVSDLLVKNLIGSTEKIDWGNDKSWELARNSIQAHSGSGRFFYWLQRYYSIHNKVAEKKEIEKYFYFLAPASFYSTKVWKKRHPWREMKKDWKKVKNRKSYLIWITKHGGNKSVTNFLKQKQIKLYWDKKAVKIWKELRNTPVPKDQTTQLLFSLGDWQMGINHFRESYKDRLSPKKYLLQLVQLGRFSHTLNVQVYYLRKLLRNQKISMDPFSLPTDLAKLLYPRPHKKLAIRYAKQYRMEGSMIYALMHQESLFRENAVSSSGAQGLMQIMPRTGKWLASTLLKTKYSNLQEPKTNIKLGTYYFSRLMKKYKGDFRWAAIAYNGGPGNLRKWKKKYYTGDFYHFIERIPNMESRNYCRITYENYIRYKILYGLNK